MATTQNPLVCPTGHDPKPTAQERPRPLLLAHEVCDWEKTPCQALWFCTSMGFSEWLKMRGNYSWFATITYSPDVIGHLNMLAHAQGVNLESPRWDAFLGPGRGPTPHCLGLWGGSCLTPLLNTFYQSPVLQNPNGKKHQPDFNCHTRDSKWQQWRSNSFLL